MDRRNFIQRSLALGAAALTAGGGFAGTSRLTAGATLPDLAVVEGDDYFAATLKAVDMLGGMKSFVSRGDRVALLINSPWKNPGTSTNPDIALAVLKMVVDAGASEVFSVENASEDYWQRTPAYEKFKELVGMVKQGGGKDRSVEIPKGVYLKKANTSAALLDCDVLIDIPIFKNHNGTHFSGNLKNMMGSTDRSTNRFFHLGGGAKGFYDDVEHLSQCIADFNLVRKPDLCLGDGTVFITENGPAGPGNLKTARTIVAGRNPVTVDSYGATLLELKPDEVLMITMAHKHGLGELDLTKVTIKKAAV